MFDVIREVGGGGKAASKFAFPSPRLPTKPAFPSWKEQQRSRSTSFFFVVMTDAFWHAHYDFSIFAIAATTGEWGGALSYFPYPPNQT